MNFQMTWTSKIFFCKIFVTKKAGLKYALVISKPSIETSLYKLYLYKNLGNLTDKERLGD